MQRDVAIAALEKFLRELRKETRARADSAALEAYAATGAARFAVGINGVALGTVTVSGPKQEIAVGHQGDFEEWAVARKLAVRWEETVEHVDVNPKWSEHVRRDGDIVVDADTGEVLPFLEVVETPARTRVVAKADNIVAALGKGDALGALMAGE